MSMSLMVYKRYFKKSSSSSFILSSY